MAYATVLVQAGSKEELTEKMAPYQSNNMGDVDRKYLVFYDETDGLKKYYEAEKDSKFKDIMPRCEQDIADKTVVELFPTFDLYCAEDRERGPDGKSWGYYYNPNARWEYWNAYIPYTNPVLAIDFEKLKYTFDDLTDVAIDYYNASFKGKMLFEGFLTRQNLYPHPTKPERYGDINFDNLFLYIDFEETLKRKKVVAQRAWNEWQKYNNQFTTAKEWVSFCSGLWEKEANGENVALQNAACEVQSKYAWKRVSDKTLDTYVSEIGNAPLTWAIIDNDGSWIEEETTILLPGDLKLIKPTNYSFKEKFWEITFSFSGKPVYFVTYHT